VRTIDDLGDLRGKRVLLRSDLNVPLEDGRVTDDGRIRASVPTIERLAGAEARVIVMAHLGRPDGKPDPRYSLFPAYQRLAELLPDREVRFARDSVGPDAKATIEALRDGGVAMLENLRFDPRETSKDDAERGAFADELAVLADVFVSDGFGVVHRKQASVYHMRLGCSCWPRSRPSARSSMTPSGPTSSCSAARRSPTSWASSRTC
jgi:phosphoglycerate kinase